MKTFKRKLIPEIEQRDLMHSFLSMLCDKRLWIDFQSAMSRRNLNCGSPIFSQCESIFAMSEMRVRELFKEGNVLHLPCGEDLLDEQSVQELKSKYQEHFATRLQAFDKQAKKKEKKKEEEENYTTDIRRVHLRLKNVPPEINYYLNLTLKYSSEIYERYFDMIKDAYVKSCQTDLKDAARTWLRPFGVLNRDLHKYKELNPKYYNVDSTALQNAIRRADKEWSSFFKRCHLEDRKPRRKKMSPNDPEFVNELEPEKYYKVLPIPCKSPFEDFMISSSTLNFDGGKIRIPKAQGFIEVDNLTPTCAVDGKLISATFKKDINNQWIAVFQYKAKYLKSSSSDDSTNE